MHNLPITLVLNRQRFFSRNFRLISCKSGLHFEERSGDACIMQNASRGMKRGPCMAHPRHVPAITGAGDLTQKNRGRSRPGWSRDRLDIDFPRCVTDDKRDPVGLYSFTTLADADRNRSQTNRLVYAVMPIPGRRDGDWMFSATAYSVKRPR